jgi:hypothetical protein
VLTVFCPRQHLPLGRPITRQFVGDNDPRDVPQALEQFPEESLRGLLVSSALEQNIQDVTVLIHSSPQVVALAMNRQKDLIKMPFIPKARTPAPELVSVLLPKLATPFPDRFVRHHDAADN